LGLVLAALIAAYMSTISTHLNWGSSYIVNDFYKRFVRQDAPEKELVLVGRISTLCLMIISGLFALLLQNALQGFKILLQIGAGTGLLFLLRWFWWRINAISEITAMTVSFMVALYFEFVHTAMGFSALEDWQKFSIGVGITTVCWMTVTLLTKPADQETLLKFIRLIKPGGPGWRRLLEVAKKEGQDVSGLVKEKWDVPGNLITVLLGCLAVYSILFSVGCWIYSSYTFAVITTITAVISSAGLIMRWGKVTIS
jgi:Na+/proline symporter